MPNRNIATPYLRLSIAGPTDSSSTSSARARLAGAEAGQDSILKSAMMKEKANYSLHPCPRCGQPTLYELGVYELCSVCGWEDDPVQSADPKYEGGANASSLREAQAHWKARSTG